MVHKTFDVLHCQVTAKTQGQRNRSRPILLVVSVFFWATSRYYRVRMAQRTQRRLPDKSWASNAWCPFLLSSSPSLPQKHWSRTWVYFPSSFVLKKLTLLQWTSLVFSICEQSTSTGAHPLRVTKWHIIYARKMLRSRKDYCIIFAMFSLTRISGWSCSHGNMMCEIRS